MALENTRAGDRLSLVHIGQTAPASRWRTEAMRSHATPRLIYIAKGQGRITVAGLTRGYGPNNLVYIPARTMYGYEVGAMVFGQMLSIPAAMAPDWPDEPVHMRLRDVAVQKELSMLFDQLDRELQSAKTGHSRAAHYHLGLLSVFFERQLSIEENDERAHTASARLVAAYTDLIETEFRSGKGVSHYAAELGVTATHLTRCCKVTCGRSALALLNDRVLYEARVMLRDTRTKVQDIASDLGFSSAAYFTRAFQARTGLTPSSFRKSGIPPVSGRI